MGRENVVRILAAWVRPGVHALLDVVYPVGPRAWPWRLLPPKDDDARGDTLSGDHEEKGGRETEPGGDGRGSPGDETDERPREERTRREYP